MTLADRSSDTAFPGTNGHLSSNRQSAVYTSHPSWNEGQTRLPLSSGGVRAKARYPHIKDLQSAADTAVKNIDSRIPVSHA